MRSRVILAVAAAIAGFWFSMCAALAAQLASGQSSTIQSHQSGQIGQRLCFTRNSKEGAVRAAMRQSCQGAAAREVTPVRLPDLPGFPAAGDRAAKSSSADRRSRRPLLRATTGAADLNRRVDHTSGKRQLSNSRRSVGFKFAAGVGMPQDRLTLEGPLSPYQQPNGNTTAAMSSNLTNMIQAQGMHFGFELQY